MDVDDLLAELGDVPTHSSTATKPTAIRQAAPASRHSAASTSSNAVHRSEGVSQPHAPTYAPRPPAQPSSSSSISRRGPPTEVDTLFEELGDLDKGPSPRAGSSIVATTRSPKASSKCIGPFIGGPDLPRGRNGSVAGALYCCDALRCTKCDFRLAVFDRREWLDDADYLFFRNNFPSAEKLAPKLQRAPASSAYCCQCSWKSATGAHRLDFGGDLRWVCSGHGV